MSVGDDFGDTSLSPVLPKRSRHYPDPNGTGAFPWPQGDTFAQAVAAGLPTAVRNKTLPFNATIRIVIDVTED